MYIKGEGAYSEIFMKDQKKHLVSRNLKNFEDMLNNDKRFLRAHKSYIVNFNHVTSYVKSNGGSLVLSNNISIPVSPEKSIIILDTLNIVKR